jgi:hypothetical protein
MAPRPQYPGPPVFADLPLCAGEEPDAPRPPIVLAPPGPEQATDPCVERVLHKGDMSTLRLEQAPPEPFLKNEKGGYVYSRWSDLDAQGSPRPETPPFEKSALFLSSPLSEKPVTWYIEVWAYEIARIITGDPVPPLGQGELGKNGGQMSRLKVRIAAHRSSGGVTRIIDLAEGIRLAVTAERVSVHILFPAPGYFGLGEIADKNLLGGFVLDTMVGGFICEAFSPPGKQLATNTITQRIAAGATDVPMDVPEGARAVSIWQTAAGPIATPEWRLQRSNTPPLPGPSLGTIILGANRRVTREDRPGNAGMITSGPPSVEFERLLTYVWDLEV